MDKGLIPWESGGDGTAVGRSGELGSTQLQPATARQMAAKLGMAYRPDLLQSNHPQALAYQRALGMAYLKEGYAKTGSLRGALRYYNGGPNFAQYPATDSYASHVLARAGGR